MSGGVFGVSAETGFRFAYASTIVANGTMVMASMIGGGGISKIDRGMSQSDVADPA